MMKKRDLTHSFILLIILVVAVGGLFLYSKLSITGITGNAVAGGSCNDTNVADGDGCSAANIVEGGWVCDGEPSVCTLLPTCSDGIQNQNETGVDCGGVCDACPICDANHLTLCLTNETCTAVGVNGYWYNSLCNAEAQPVCDATHLTLCLDEPTCIAATGYWYNSLCNAEQAPTCSDGVQNQDEEGVDCGGVCDACEEETTTDEEETADEEIPSTTMISPATGGAVENSCGSSWQCGEWTACENSQRTRICVDANNCGSSEGMPSTSESCVSEIKETCDDGIKNQDEEGVDCGGVCEKCKKNFFSVIGSAISGPIETGKTFFQKEVMGNKTRTFIVLGGIVFVIAGFAVFKRFAFKKVSSKKKGEF